ncbi:MAG: ABC transporter permease [Acidobacteriota bacterium]
MITRGFSWLGRCIRPYRRRPAAAVLIVLTLALGVGANAAVFSAIDGILLRPLPFADPDRLMVVEAVRGDEPGPLSMREVADLEEQPGLFSEVAAFLPDSAYTLSGQGEAEKLPAILVTHDLVSLLGVDLLHGGAWPESFDRERNFGILLGHRVWQRKFGSRPDVVGTTVALDASPTHSPSYTIYGVLPEGFEFPDDTAIYRSIYISRYFPNIEDRNARQVVAVARLAPGVRTEEAGQRIAALGRRLAEQYPETNREVGLRLNPLRERYLGPVRPYVLLLFGATVAVLLIACVNVANLLLGVALARDREMAVRAALGAGRLRLAAQVLGEGLVLAAVGGLLGIAAAVPALHLLRLALAERLPLWMDLSLDGRALTAALVLSLIAGVGASLVPALRISAARLHQALKEGGRGGGAGRRQALARRGLVVSEVALCLVLLVAAGLVVRTFRALMAVDPGVRAEGVATFQVALPWTYAQEDVERFQREVLAGLVNLPGVSGSAFNSNPPLTGIERVDRSLVRAEGQDDVEVQNNPYAFNQVISDDYFEVAGVPLLAGRAFDRRDHADAPAVAIVSQRFAERLWPGESAVGKRFRVTEDTPQEASWREVVGVVGDVRREGPGAAPGFDLYWPLQQRRAAWGHYFARTTTPPAALREPARRVVAAVDSGQPVVDFRTLEQRILDSVWRERLTGTVFGIFSVLALVLAATGVYGVMSYLVRQRRRETGVRMALGARRRDVLAGVLREALVLVAIGVASGAVVALIAAQGLRGVLFGVAPWDPGAFAVGAGTLAVVGLLAALGPALRAIGTDPAEVLQAE